MLRVGLSAVIVLVSLSAASAQQNWQGCAAEGAICTVPYATAVRYGANGVYRFKNVNGPILCSYQLFGDPLFNVRKSCSFAVKSNVAPTQSVVSMGRTITGNCAGSYRKWQQMRGAKAFAITADGRSCGWSQQRRNLARRKVLP